MDREKLKSRLVDAFLEYRSKRNIAEAQGEYIRATTFIYKMEKIRRIVAKLEGREYRE